MIMIIPTEPINGSLNSVTLFNIDKEYDQLTKSTKFFIDSPLPLGVVRTTFPMIDTRLPIL